MLPALVLTAGLGTRLDPLTRLVAKAAVPLGDATLIERLLAWLRREGVSDVVLNLHHLPHTITRIVGDGGEFLGLALAPAIARDPEWTAELGYAVAEAARGRGVATQALRLLTDWAFAEGILRAELIISPDNEGSKRVAERAGYVYEGLLRSKYFKGGRREDQEIWSRLPTDPV